MAKKDGHCANEIISYRYLFIICVPWTTVNIRCPRKPSTVFDKHFEKSSKKMELKQNGKKSFIKVYKVIDLCS